MLQFTHRAARNARYPALRPPNAALSLKNAEYKMSKAKRGIGLTITLNQAGFLKALNVIRPALNDIPPAVLNSMSFLTAMAE